MFRPHTFGKNLFILAAPEIMVHVDKVAYDKMWQYVHQAPEEISWMGFCTKNEYNFYVHDVLLFKQDCMPTHTEAVDFGLADAAESLLKTKGGKEKLKQMRLWGHSHVNMGTDPSPQDIKQTHMFKDGGCDWAIRLICNKEGKMSFSVLLYSENLEIRDTPWRFNSPENNELEEAIKAEIAEKVAFSKDKKQVSTVYGQGWENWNGWQNGYGGTKTLKARNFSDLEKAYIDFNELEQLGSGGLVDKTSKTIVYSNWDVEQFEKDVKDFEQDFIAGIVKASKEELGNK